MSTAAPPFRITFYNFAGVLGDGGTGGGVGADLFPFAGDGLLAGDASTFFPPLAALVSTDLDGADFLSADLGAGILASAFAAILAAFWSLRGTLGTDLDLGIMNDKWILWWHKSVV